MQNTSEYEKFAVYFLAVSWKWKTDRTLRRSGYVICIGKGRTQMYSYSIPPVGSLMVYGIVPLAYQ